MKKAVETLVFCHGRWEIARQVFNNTTGRLQWERRDGSYICGSGEERAQQPMPPCPAAHRAEPPGDAEVYDAVVATAKRRGVKESSLADVLGCSRDQLRPGLLRLEQNGMVFHVYRAKGCFWHVR